MVRPYLVCGCTHFPYQHENYLKFLKKVHKDYNCRDKIIHLGDIFDFHAMSRHTTETDSPSPDEEYERALKECKRFTRVFPRGELVIGNHDCQKFDTECQTINGWKYIKDITKDDLVAQYNIKSKEITFVKPLHIIKTYSEELINFEGTYTNQCVTPGHDVVINGEKIKARDLLGKKINEKEIPSSGYYNAPGCGFDLDDIKLLTWVIMDGTIVDYKKYDSESKKIRIQFKLSYQHKIDKLKKLLDSLDIQYTFKEATMSGYNKLQPYYIRIYGDEARRINKLLNGKKLIPSSFAYMNKEELDIFLETLLDTDGSMSSKAISWITIEKHNVDIIQTACILNGYAMKYKSKYHSSGFNNGKLQYHSTIRINGDYWQNIKISKEKYEDFAYCLTVPSGAFITRRGGKAVISGNCIPEKQMKDIGLSKLILKPPRELMGLPIGWNVHPLDYYIKELKVWASHGIQSNGPNGALNSALHKMDSYSQAHCHSEAGVKYLANKERLVFGLNVGSLADNKSLAMRYAKYNKKKGIMGCGLIYSSSHAQFIPMKMEI